MIERILKIMVGDENEPIFSNNAYTIEIEDEAAGEFVIVKSQHDGESIPEGIAIDPSEWPALRSAIDRMIGECKDDYN